MNYSKKTLVELKALCKTKNIKGYSCKKKSEIIQLLQEGGVPPPPVSAVRRLNYIGSKFQLLDWLTENIKTETGWNSFENKTVADIFSGTGIVSHHFRTLSAKVISNDAELYSYIITHAMTRSVYTDTCKKIIENLQASTQETAGFVTRNYSPYESNDRKFFTVKNAMRIDYIRAELERIKDTISDDEYKFVLASVIISADAVSNVPAVYGCFLKNFKAKATKDITLLPLHTITAHPVAGSVSYNADVLDLDIGETDMVYLDPPYNNRQYSKNYFPLNIIANSTESAALVLHGKTGIPDNCFISPFCKKDETVENAFDLLFGKLKTKWIFMSYNSESTLSKEKILKIMNRYGTATVIERDYKRFKSFEYNNDVDIKEYLFCLRAKIQ